MGATEQEILIFKELNQQHDHTANKKNS